MIQPQSITFFVDRCLGSRYIVETLQSAGINIEIHDEHFDKGAQDIDWLPEVGKRGWVVLTKDANIGKNTLERIAVARAQIKMFALASQNLSGRDMAAIFLRDFQEINYPNKRTTETQRTQRNKEERVFSPVF